VTPRIRRVAGVGNFTNLSQKTCGGSDAKFAKFAKFARFPGVRPGFVVRVSHEPDWIIKGDSVAYKPYALRAATPALVVET
jgi:hypothetical protein